MKPIIWLGNSRERLKRFPNEARLKGGHEFQLGSEPSDWRAMSSAGSGVIEIRLHKPHEHRIIYVARHKEAVFVLNAFERKMQRTPRHQVETASRNYAQIEIELQKISKSWKTN